MNGILIDDNGDILVQNGTVTIGNITQDVCQRVIEAYPGEFKEYPIVGCRIRQRIGANKDPFLTTDIKRQLNNVGVKVSDITIDGDDIQVKLK
jgi:hypothetical protein